MGQSQSNQTGAANDEKIAKITALMSSANPEDQALLAKMIRDVDKILKGIDMQRTVERNAYMTNKEIANKNYERKMIMMREREKKFRNVLDKKKTQNAATQNRIASNAAAKAREGLISGNTS
jgi:hypothetical protein